MTQKWKDLIVLALVGVTMGGAYLIASHPTLLPGAIVGGAMVLIGVIAALMED